MNKVEKKVEKKKKSSVAPQNESKEETLQTEQPKLTQAQKLLKSVNEKRAAMKARMKGVTNTRISFDDEGNQATVEAVAPTLSKRPAVKKPEPKKRKAEEEEPAKTEKKPPKKAKNPNKPKKAKAEIEEIKKDSKQADALAYVRLFVLDRSSWKFNKVHQIWLLQHLYELPDEDFDGVLEYLKDLQGSAREKTRKEAEDKVPKKVVNSLTAYDGDDFDAEKLMAQAVNTTEANIDDDDDDENESVSIRRARKIARVLR
ncbi:hypothetical protein K501DRAFT_231654 [Backusella circina FSU 941]|nr:hypothetical protein K501DRAFT_231654 [Backusella circina FSU 941]